LQHHVKKRYSFFHHIIESDIPLPELVELTEGDVQGMSPAVNFEISKDSSEFTKDREWLHQWLAPDDSITLSFAQDGGRLFLHFPYMACFVISNHGQFVTCYAQKTLLVETIRHLFLDQVLPRLFAHFYSYSVFHASCISVKGKGICFLADSGWGKSTMAAGFAAAGHTILTDDCLCIVNESGLVSGIPAYRGVRLLPDSMEKLGDSFARNGGAVAEYTSKKRISLRGQVCGIPDALPVKAFFLLTSPKDIEDCASVEICPVGGAQAMKEMLKNSFCLDVHDGQWQKEHFKRVASLVTSGLPIYSLGYLRNYKRLPEVVRGITDTLDQLEL